MRMFSPIPTGSAQSATWLYFNNLYGSTRGWVRNSAAYMDKSTRQLRQRSLGEGLA